MPFTSIAPQQFVIDTAFSINVTCTAPSGLTITDILVDGLLRGFKATYTLSQSDTVATITITGTPDATVTDEIWDVTATYSDDTTDELEIEYSVIPKVPVVVNPGTQVFYRGQENELEVEVRNRPNRVSARGPLVGLKSEGRVISGNDLVLTPASLNREIEVYGENTSGSDEEDFNFSVQDPVED